MARKPFKGLSRILPHTEDVTDRGVLIVPVLTTNARPSPNRAPSACESVRRVDFVQVGFLKPIVQVTPSLHIRTMPSSTKFGKSVNRRVFLKPELLGRAQGDRDPQFFEGDRDQMRPSDGTRGAVNNRLAAARRSRPVSPSCPREVAKRLAAMGGSDPNASRAAATEFCYIHRHFFHCFGGGARLPACRN